jgi:hypothetical protein
MAARAFNDWPIRKPERSPTDCHNYQVTLGGTSATLEITNFGLA